MTPTNPDVLTAADASALSGFTEYRKKLLTSISDSTFPAGTIYATPEGLRAEDEETRCAFDVQGGIYPIRESVFQASYEIAAVELREALGAVIDRWYRLGMIRFSRRDDGSDDLLLRDELTKAVLNSVVVSSYE